MAATVTVLPGGIDLDVEAGETLFLAARRQGWRWPTLCDGNGTCRTCFVTVQEHGEHCGAINALEAEGLAALGRPPGVTRLACQLTVTGPVTVLKRGVRREEQKQEAR